MYIPSLLVKSTWISQRPNDRFDRDNDKHQIWGDPFSCHESGIMFIIMWGIIVIICHHHYYNATIKSNIIYFDYDDNYIFWYVLCYVSLTLFGVSDIINFTNYQYYHYYHCDHYYTYYIICPMIVEFIVSVSQYQILMTLPFYPYLE